MGDPPVVRVGQGLAILGPGGVRGRLTLNINIEVQSFAHHDGDLSQGPAVNPWLQGLVLALEVVGFRSGRSNSAGIFCPDTESVGLSQFNASGLATLQVLLGLSALDPEVIADLSTLNDVVENPGAAIVLGRRPFQLKEVVIIVDALGFARRTGGIIRVLGQDCVNAGQVVGLAFRVDSLHPELVLMVLLQTLDGDLEVAGLATGHVHIVIAHLHFLHNVVGDGGSAIVQRHLPQNITPVGIDVLKLHGALGHVRGSHTQHLQIGLVTAVLVDRLQGVGARELALGTHHVEHGLVSLIVDAQMHGRLDLSLAQVPVLVGIRLTRDLDVEFERFAHLDLDRVHVGPVNNGRGVPSLAGDLVGGLGGLTRTGPVDRPDPEPVLAVLSEISHLGIQVIRVGVHGLDPLRAKLFLLLNDIVGDPRAAVISWLLPAEFDPLSVPVIHRGLLRGTWGIIGVLGTNGSIGFQGFTLTLVVDSLDTEQVEAALVQALHVKLTHLALSFTAGQPDPLVGVHFLHNVVLDRIPAIILGRLPVQVARVAGDVGDL